MRILLLVSVLLVCSSQSNAEVSREQRIAWIREQISQKQSELAQYRFSQSASERYRIEQAGRLGVSAAITIPSGIAYVYSCRSWVHLLAFFPATLSGAASFIFTTEIAGASGRLLAFRSSIEHLEREIAELERELAALTEPEP